MFKGFKVQRLQGSQVSRCHKMAGGRKPASTKLCNFETLKLPNLPVLPATRTSLPKFPVIHPGLVLPVDQAVLLIAAENGFQFAAHFFVSGLAGGGHVRG